jgi:hypothetical protein
MMNKNKRIKNRRTWTSLAWPCLIITDSTFGQQWPQQMGNNAHKKRGEGQKPINESQSMLTFMCMGCAGFNFLEEY